MHPKTAAVASPAYTTSVNTWKPEAHPRDHASNRGRFSAKETGAPEVGVGVATLDRPDRAPTTTEDRADAIKALALLERAAKIFARRYNFTDETRQDLVQEALVELLESGVAGSVRAIIDNPRFATHVVKTAAARYVHARVRGDGPDVRGEDMKARALLRKAMDARELDQGRPMHSSEIRGLADEIRMELFAPGHRPKEDFYITDRHVSLDAPQGTSDLSLADSLHAVDTRSPFAVDDSAIANLVDGLSLGKDDGDLTAADGTRISRVTPGEVKGEAWNHFAAANDAPTAIPKSLTRRQGVDAGNVIGEYRGGLIQMCADWRSGETDERANSALFAPFGELTLRGQEKVVGQLLRFSAFAEHLHKSARLIAMR